MKNYEEKLKEAHKLLEQLDNPDITLYEGIELYKKGIKIIKEANQILQDAKLIYEEIKN